MTTWTPNGERHTFTARVGGYTLTQTLDQLTGLSEGPIRVAANGTVIDAPDAPTEPEAWVDTDGSEHFGDSPWAPLTGHSGQHGYRGPVMHASESIGGGMADHILATPGLYVAIVVEAFDDDGEQSEEPAGWALLHIPAEIPPAAPKLTRDCSGCEDSSYPHASFCRQSPTVDAVSVLRRTRPDDVASWPL